MFSKIIVIVRQVQQPRIISIVFLSSRVHIAAGYFVCITIDEKIRFKVGLLKSLYQAEVGQRQVFTA